MSACFPENVINKNNNFVSLLQEELEKREGAHGTLFCTFEKMSFNLPWARKTILNSTMISLNIFHATLMMITMNKQCSPHIHLDVAPRHA